MRRVLIALLLCFLPSLAAAQGMSLGQVCKGLIGSQVTQCMGAAAGRYIDPGAAAQCSRLIGSQVITCVGAIAGKDYSPEDAQVCGGLIGSQVIDCLNQAGRPHMERRMPPPPPPPGMGMGGGGGYRPMSVTDIRSEIAASLEALRANDPASAERRLRRLLSDLR